MSNPFLAVHIQPAYGKSQCVITWNVHTNYADGDFYIFKSYTKGTAPWELLNEVPVKGNLYIDDNPTSLIFYRILLVHNGVEYDSPVTGVFDRMSKLQYGGISKMMRLEYDRMVSGNGIQVLHYIPLIRGEYADDTDPMTEQKYGSHCKDGGVNDIDYGQKFKGGYAPPVYTWMEIRQFGNYKNEEDNVGLAMDSDLTHEARMLAFPTPSPGDIVVHPSTDLRYGVKSPVRGDYFRGVFPISYNVQLQLINKSDPRYGMPIPLVLPKPLWATYR